MSSLLTDPIQTLIDRHLDGRLHHAILCIGQSLPALQSQSSPLIQHVLGLPKDREEHPDLFHLRPSGKARIITVEKTRGLISNLQQSSNQGGAKIALIHEVDRMRKEAANAFLKTLEEPPRDTFLILLTTRPYSLLPTIRSRCLQARFSMGHEQILDPSWSSWLSSYGDWILSLLDREKLKQDRISPFFQAYGLAASLLQIIHSQADRESKEAKTAIVGLEEKEKDALDAGVRKGVRTRLLREVAEATRAVATKAEHGSLSSTGLKLARAISSLERCVGLMEVNLKDETAIEEFYLSSLRIWTAK